MQGLGWGGVGVFFMETSRVWRASGKKKPRPPTLTLFFSLHHFLSPMPSSAPALAMALEALAVKQQLLVAALERAALAEAALERATRAGV